MAKTKYYFYTHAWKRPEYANYIFTNNVTTNFPPFEVCLENRDGSNEEHVLISYYEITKDQHDQLDGWVN